MTEAAAVPSSSGWPGLEKFNLVQDYLEKNKSVENFLGSTQGKAADPMPVLLLRLLLTEINTNHEIKTPDALARNVLLIRELDSNVAKVCALFDVQHRSVKKVQP